MAANYTAIYAAASNAAFQNRCLVGAWVAAVAIQTESTNTPGHAQRLDWSNNILRGKQRITPQVLAVQVLQSATLLALTDPTTGQDSDIQAQITVQINQLIAIG